MLASLVYMIPLAIWLLFVLGWLVVFPAIRTKRRAKKLRVGNIYVRRGKNPFDSERMVIVDMKAGHVQWHYVNEDGSLSSYAHSGKADYFADSKELVSTP